jgi:diguanylate cyclase (GGDEF)-like protein
VQTELNEIFLRFFLEDVGGNLITDAEGRTVYEDARVRRIRRGNTNWAAACPPPREGQRGERWDLLDKDSDQTYMVLTSTMKQGDRTLQLHHLADSSAYMELFRDMGAYSQTLQEEKEHDGLTGLYNKGKFMVLKRSLFQSQSSLAVFNMDVNDLKQMNDNFGHEAGDALINKAAESLRRIEARNVLTFRVGGDEFMAVALHMSREEALELKAKWEAGLAELNRRDDGVSCVVACGFAYGEQGYDLEELLAEADRKMYEDKKAKKGGRS